MLACPCYDSIIFATSVNCQNYKLQQCIPQWALGTGVLSDIFTELLHNFSQVKCFKSNSAEEFVPKEIAHITSCIVIWVEHSKACTRVLEYNVTMHLKYWFNGINLKREFKFVQKERKREREKSFSISKFYGGIANVDSLFKK